MFNYALMISLRIGSHGPIEIDDTLWQFNGLLLKMAREIVDLPINSMVIFHSYVNVYQRVWACLMIHPRGDPSTDGSVNRAVLNLWNDAHCFGVLKTPPMAIFQGICLGY